MFVLGNFVIGVGVAFRVLINIEIIFILVAAILSWFPVWQRAYYYFQSLADIVEKPVRKLIPRIGPVDISPIISIVLLIFLDKFLVQTIIDLGYYIK